MRILITMLILLGFIATATALDYLVYRANDYWWIKILDPDNSMKNHVISIYRNGKLWLNRVNAGHGSIFNTGIKYEVPPEIKIYEFDAYDISE